METIAFLLFMVPILCLTFDWGHLLYVHSKAYVLTGRWYITDKTMVLTRTLFGNLPEWVSAVLVIASIIYAIFSFFALLLGDDNILVFFSWLYFIAAWVPVLYLAFLKFLQILVKFKRFADKSGQ